MRSSIRQPALPHRLEVATKVVATTAKVVAVVTVIWKAPVVSIRKSRHHARVWEKGNQKKGDRFFF